MKFMQRACFSETLALCEGYATDLITDLSLEWLKRRDCGRPFCLMCHHKAPHGPWQYPPRHESLFDSVAIPEPVTLFEDLSHRCEG
ncbi:MAG: sulfatase-like hydrolase/transferase [Candidatus Sumerlaeota bacterium]|nr:sulfatase-like hydrolase/transferase [Candidatus Sumerlaeota bacterium]